MKRSRFRFAAILLSGFAIGGAAIAQDEDSTAQRIPAEVRHELVTLPNYGVFDDLEFKVNGNIVTLMGQVTNPTLKGAAEVAVKQIEGVGRVENRVRVLPFSPHDDQIRFAVYRTVYGQSPLDHYAFQAVPPIHIVVESGHVTLVGVVATSADKDLVGMRANSVSGVFSVDNRLRLEEK